ncbi:Phage protein [Leucobacter sp. 7(1)]|uniref:DUF723 domain-containing protein n=1 Tax=Leucobacter sp. 7(1) TaxID=1255613 RepID=UPI00097F40AA|nr:DUF723 domain-containing protein [Leucobacter sp. 7(1)]SJN09879.1 Phage protein [Leucobacter sp. 7(1)]
MARRQTTEEWIAKARAVHGDLYDYSQSVYDKATSKITIICELHGPWRPIARDHTNSSAGCPECGGVRRLSREDWIYRARQIHGDKFDYSKVNYTTLTAEVAIICPAHGEFLQQAEVHLRGFGCSQCSGRRRGTTEEWIAKARAVHGDLYDYSKAVYVNANTSLIIICPKHGEFQKQPRKHLDRASGCTRCSGRFSPTTEEWIAQAVAKFGGRFDYSEVTYRGADARITILCPSHGSFSSTPYRHLLSRHGCPECANAMAGDARRLGLDGFIERARLVHGFKYDYAQVDYKSTEGAVTIVCPGHGPFSQSAGNHLNGAGCPRCAGRYNWTTEEWVALVDKVHGGRFDYSLVEYVNSATKVTIICPEHGQFTQIAKDHRRGIGCARCSGYIPPTTAEWVDMTKGVHGERYDYSQTEYVNQNTQVTIVCRNHGPFSMSPRGHVEDGSGCPSCPRNKSRGEELVAQALNQLGVAYVREWKHSTLGGRGKGRMRFDFLLPAFNALVEFDGRQHREPVRWTKQVSVKQSKVMFIRVQHNDRLKSRWAAEHGYELLRLSNLRTVDDEIKQFIQALSAMPSDAV